MGLVTYFVDWENFGGKSYLEYQSYMFKRSQELKAITYIEVKVYQAPRQVANKPLVHSISSLKPDDLFFKE